MNNTEKKKEELLKIGSVAQKTDLYSIELYIMCSIMFTLSNTALASHIHIHRERTDIFTLHSILQRTANFKIPLKLVRITGN